MTNPDRAETYLDPQRKRVLCAVVHIGDTNPALLKSFFGLKHWQGAGLLGLMMVLARSGFVEPTGSKDTYRATEHGRLRSTQTNPYRPRRAKKQVA